MKRNFIINCATIIALGLVAAGCSNDNIDKGSNEMQEQAKSTFPVADIDPTQDWNTSATRSATVSIGGEPYNSYDIYLFTEMPTSGVATPTVATQKGVRGGRTLQFTFDIAKAQTELYVGRNGVDGYFVTPVSLTTDSTYVADLDAVATTKTRSFSDKKDEMSGNPFESVTAPYESNFTKTKPSGDNVITNVNNSYNSKGNPMAADVYSVVLSNTTLEGNYYNANPKDVYIEGNVTLTNMMFCVGNSPVNVYLLSGSSLTIEKLTANGQELNIYVPSTASLTVECALAANGSHQNSSGTWVSNRLNVYNKGTVTLNKVAKVYDPTSNQQAQDGLITANTLLYNEGTVNVTGPNFHIVGSGMFINKGVCKVAGDITLDNNHADVLNDGYMKVGGSIYVTQADEWLVNTGNLDIAKTLDVKAGNNTVYNACQIKIGETFDLTGGSGNAAINTLSDGAYYCKNLKMGNNEVLMADRSAFIVTGTTTLAGQGGDDFQGFKKTGSTDVKALVKLGKILDAQGIAISHENTLQVAGNIVITADNISTLVNATADNGVGKVVLLTDGATYTLESDVTVTPNNSETATCLSWSADQDDGSGTQNTPTNYTYAFEDMMLGDNSDYDFNDVVLRVTTPDTEGKVTVTLEAAGATRQIAVKHKSTDGTVRTLWEDVHTALGVNAGTMVNTGTGVTSDETPTVSDFYIGSITTNGDFYILVDGTTEVHIPQYTEGFANGDVPYALQVTGTDWKWPTETTTITKAYEKFASWASNALEDTDWYKTVTIANVYTK